ncbi:hypothetical protein [Acidocella sp.]|jgi:hypothetical protein|uniref:hypothetical protein n=1 Tax=Acidocella sp. TaxID=50710 RepID=UPI002F4067CF
MAQQAVFQLMVVAAAVLILSGCTQMSRQSADLATSLNAGGLVGATPATLSSAFGPPALRRVDGTAQVWLYHSAVCGLNLILYPDRSGMPRVALAVPDNGDPVSCTASLRRDLTDAALEHATSS